MLDRDTLSAMLYGPIKTLWVQCCTPNRDALSAMLRGPIETVMLQSSNCGLCPLSQPFLSRQWGKQLATSCEITHKLYHQTSQGKRASRVSHRAICIRKPPQHAPAHTQVVFELNILPKPICPLLTCLCARQSK